MGANRILEPPLRTLVFGLALTEVWGAAWLPDGGRRGVLLLAEGKHTEVCDATLESKADATGWRLCAGGRELELSPASEAVERALEENAPGRREQRCLVGGDVLDGVAQLPGCLGEHTPPGELERFDSVREVTVWFDGGEAISLLALRPRRAKGHERDAVAAVIIDPEGWPTVEEPRLSTTYAADGRPMRMTLELWSEEEDRPPRRAAGESVERHIAATAAGWRVHAELLRCHGRSGGGSGVYLLARPA